MHSVEVIASPLSALNSSHPRDGRSNNPHRDLP